MASNKMFDKFTQQTRVFADFWLGVAGAGMQGAAAAVGGGKSHSLPEPSEAQDAIRQRLGEGLKVALDVASNVARQTEESLKRIQSPQPSETHVEEYEPAEENPRREK